MIGAGIRTRARGLLGAGLLGAAALAMLACANRPPAPASLAVQVFAGAPASARPGDAAAPSRQRLAVVLDLGRSMQTPVRRGGPTRAAAARAATVQLLERTPLETPVVLEALGVASGAACTPAVEIGGGAQVGAAPPGASPAALVGPVRALAAHSESSLGGALARVGEIVGREGPAAAWHVVVVSDLGAECDGDPCEALDRLIASGVRVDIVDLGDSDVKACPVRAAVPASVAAMLAPPPAPGFRVETAKGTPTDLARGRADGEAVVVPAGRVRLVIALDPPLAIGPIDLAPGEHARVRVLDFPAAKPPVRNWRIERTPAKAKDGAP